MVVWACRHQREAPLPAQEVSCRPVSRSARPRRAHELLWVRHPSVQRVLAAYPAGEKGPVASPLRGVWVAV